jgi:hypothetical protein
MIKAFRCAALCETVCKKNGCSFWFSLLQVGYSSGNRLDMMISIKILCPCGQKFAFDVEPVAGRMPSRVNCPACGRDATLTANQQIQAETPMKAGSPVKKTKNTAVVVGVCVASLTALLVCIALYRSNHRLTQPQPVATVATVAAAPAPKPTAKVERDPNQGEVGIIFDRNLTTHQIEITRVLSKSPAAKAGLTGGVILNKIDNNPVDGIKTRGIAKMLLGPIGSIVKLELIDPKTGTTNIVQVARENFRK